MILSRCERGTYESKTPNDTARGSLLIWSGDTSLRVHAVRPVSSSNVAFGSRAVKIQVMSIITKAAERRAYMRTIL